MRVELLSRVVARLDHPAEHDLGLQSSVELRDALGVDAREHRLQEGTTREVALHDGSRIVLKKLDHDYDPTNKDTALHVLHETASRGEYATGLLYIDTAKRDFCSMLNLVDEPLAGLPLERTRPSRSALEEIMERQR